MLLTSLRQKAWAYYTSGNLVSANVAMEAATEISPNHKDSQLLLGLIKAKKGEVSDCLDRIELLQTWKQRTQVMMDGQRFVG